MYYLEKHKLVEVKKNAFYIAKTITGEIGKMTEYVRNKGKNENFYLKKIIKLQLKRKIKMPSRLITKIANIVTVYYCHQSHFFSILLVFT